jgi:hypothetical protein
MRLLSGLADLAETALHVLALLFFAYGAYLAVWGNRLRRKPDVPGRETSGRGVERRAWVRRQADRQGLQPQRRPA